MKKMNALLSDEESVRQLSELAQMIDEESNSKTENFSETISETNSDAVDISQIMKIAGLMNSLSENDSNTELLTALKPHLKEERQKRVDKAVKLLRIMSLISAAKENDMLNDIL